VACSSLPAFAASDTAFNKLTMGGILAGILFFIFLIAAVGAIFILAGHYSFRANRVVAERVCYSLGAILVVKAASENRLPSTVSTIVALLASVLTYYVLMRVKPNS
jgi:hypothetical protein